MQTEVFDIDAFLSSDRLYTDQSSYDNEFPANSPPSTSPPSFVPASPLDSFWDLDEHSFERRRGSDCSSVGMAYGTFGSLEPTATDGSGQDILGLYKLFEDMDSMKEGTYQVGEFSGHAYTPQHSTPQSEAKPFYDPSAAIFQPVEYEMHHSSTQPYFNASFTSALSAAPASESADASTFTHFPPSPQSNTREQSLHTASGYIPQLATQSSIPSNSYLSASPFPSSNSNPMGELQPPYILFTSVPLTQPAVGSLGRNPPSRPPISRAHSSPSALPPATLNLPSSSASLSPSPSRPATSIFPPKVHKHACSECPKTFARRQDLRRHETTHRPGVKPFKCLVCMTGFTRSDALHRHQKAKRCGL